MYEAVAFWKIEGPFIVILSTTSESHLDFIELKTIVQKRQMNEITEAASNQLIGIFIPISTT